MFESIEDAVATWKEEYSFIEDAVVTGMRAAIRLWISRSVKPHGA